MPAAIWTLVAAVAAAAAALVATHLVHRAVVRLGRSSRLWAEVAAHAHRPTQLICVLLAVQEAVRQGPATGEWAPVVRHTLWLSVIGGVAWAVAAVVLVLEDVALARFRTDVPDNRQARRVHTQVVMLRRVSVAVVAVLAFGVMLTTFDQVRAVGASLLASAGVAGVVAALAAQSLLGNVIAGMQLAFGDALRLDDVVVVEGEWGRVEELTLGYVVVHIWDDRRLVLPTSYFITNPYQNWTRNSAALLGTVELDVDWSVDVAAAREELRRALERNPQWDRRVCVLQVTEAVGALIRLRALVSAADAPTLWDLRCTVREHLVTWLRDHNPTALPRTRAELVERPGGPGPAMAATGGPGRPGPATVPATGGGAASIDDGRVPSDGARGSTGDGPAGRDDGAGGDERRVSTDDARVSTDDGRAGRGDGAGGDDAVFGCSGDGQSRGSTFAGPEPVQR